MSWIQTHSGAAWQLDNPRVEDVRIEDVAHSLAHICRYTGHTSIFYSVAQHSVFVYLIVKERFPGRPLLALAALLHDAHEAYLGDWASPFKVMLRKCHPAAYEAIRVVEVQHQRVISKWAGLPGENVFGHVAIKRADMEMLATERRDLLGHCDREWLPMPEPLGKTIVPQDDPFDAKTSFLLALTCAMNDAHGPGNWPHP